MSLSCAGSASTTAGPSQARAPRSAIQFNKRLANADLVDRINRVIDASLAMEAVTFATADHREAVASFLERREAVFGRDRK